MGPFAAVVLLLYALVTPAGAQTRSYSIESFKVSLQVNPDSSLLIQETIAFAFRGRHQGIYRTIPIRYERQGFHFDLRIDGAQVLDDDGRPLKTEVSYPGRDLKIKAWVPGAQDATRTVTILYRVRRGLLAFDDHDELYWNVVGTEWAATIQNAEAVVGLPRTVPMESVRVTAFTGPLGAVGRDYTLHQAENVLLFQATRPLGIREGLTVVVGWPKGHVAFPSTAQRVAWFLLDQRWFALPLLVLAACIVAWRRFGRDPLREQSVKAEYEPPAGVRPGEAGALVDETVHPRDVVATVVDLAVRGHLHIRQVSGAGLLGPADYLFTLPKPWLGNPDIEDFEVIVLAQVFGHGGVSDRKLLSEVRRDSKAILPPIRDQLYRDLVKKKYFLASPQSVRRFWRIIGGLLLALPFSLFSVWEGAAPGGTLSMLVALASSGLLVLAFARVMPRKTFKGARTKLQILGFQEFLERAEKDRLNRLPTDTLHKWLPYAIALGVEEAWIWNFEGLAADAPAWYESDTPFSIRGYSSGIQGFGRDVRSAWLSGARGSGAGGSSFGGGGSGSSGGSSGGGGGGGGGGTF